MSRQLSFDFSEKMTFPTTTPLLPIRPRPLEDEILSSWLIRIGFHNGLTPIQLSYHLIGDRSLVGIEVDRIPPQNFLNSVVAHTGATEDEVLKMAFSKYEDNINLRFEKHGNIPHVVSLGYKSVKTGAIRGSAFCPDCLREDQEPYFRKSWRYTFAVSCNKHDRLLLDECENCGYAFIYFRSLGQVENRYERDAITICQHCGFDIRNTLTRSSYDKIVPYISEIQRKLIGTAFKRWSVDFDNFETSYHAIPWFAGIKLLFRFLSSSATPSEVIQEIIDGKNLPFKYAQYKVILNSDFKVPKSDPTDKIITVGMNFEHKTVRGRALTLAVLSIILDNWPHSIQKALRKSTKSQRYWAGLLNSNTPHWIYEALVPSIQLTKLLPFKERDMIKKYLISKGYSNPTQYHINNFHHTGKFPLLNDKEKKQYLLEARARYQHQDALEREMERKRKKII
ncbi:TniQ family protein [Undibacterium sp. Ji83W]|uniref:TniQ family protein n=1 Tax=Undibacterium sp. Ji83W TaxID=3413043 RepID=UPI003BF1460D